MGLVCWSVARPVPAQDYSTPLVKYGIGALLCATLTPDETQLVTGGADGNVRFWSAGSGQLLRTLACHEHEITAMAFSGDGKRLLTGSRDGAARLWDAADGRLLLSVLDDQWGIDIVAISADGQTLLTGNTDRIYVWNSTSGRLLRTIVIYPTPTKGAKPATRHPGTLSKWLPRGPYMFYGYILAFSPDGSRLVTDDSQNRQAACLWDTGTGTLLRTLTGHTSYIGAVAFSADSKKVVTGGSDRTVRIWDAASGQPLQTLAGPSNFDPWDVAISPDGKRVATINNSYVPGASYIDAWDAASGWQHKQWVGNEDEIYSIGFTKDSKRLLTYGMDQTVRVWDAASGQEVRQYTGHIGPIGNCAAVALSRDGQRVLTGHMDKKARLWDAQSGQLLRTLTGYTDHVRFVAFSADGKALLTSDWKEARVSDPATGQTLRSNTFTSAGLSTSMAISPDGKRVLAGCSGGVVRVLDLETGKTLMDLTSFNTANHFFAYSIDGKWMMAGGLYTTSLSGSLDSYISSLRVFDAQTGANMGRYEWPYGLTDFVISADIAADGKKITIASYNNKAWMYSFGNSTPLFTWNGPYNAIESVAFAPDSRRALIGTVGIQSCDALLWDSQSGTILARLPHPDDIYAAIFSADGQRALTGCWDGAARLWDVSSGARAWGRYE